MPILNEEYQNRFERVLESVKRENFDLLLVYTRGNRNMYGNLLYLTGYYSFDPCIEGALLALPSGDARLLLNFEWDLDRAALTSWLPRKAMNFSRELGGGLIRFCQEAGLASARIGLVGEAYLPISLFKQLQSGLPEATFVTATALVERERLIKSESEIEAMRVAARITNKPSWQEFRHSKQVYLNWISSPFACVPCWKNQADEIAFTHRFPLGR
jgi:Xaa-Pro aminopeptidase